MLALLALALGLGCQPRSGTMNSFADLISLAGVGVGGHVFGLANGTQALPGAQPRV